MLLFGLRRTRQHWWAIRVKRALPSQSSRGGASQSRSAQIRHQLPLVAQASYPGLIDRKPYEIDMGRSSKPAPNVTPHAWLRKALPRRRLLNMLGRYAFTLP